MITEGIFFNSFKETPKIFCVLDEFNKNFNAELDKLVKLILKTIKVYYTEMPPKVSRITFEGYLFFSNISHHSDA